MKPQSTVNLRRQRGVVLFVAMIVLVVMALAGVAMVRQSGTGLSIAGNLAFKQNATSAGDLGTEAAINWWGPLKNTATLNADVPAQGYFSDWGSAVGDPRLPGDPSLYDWSNARVIANDGTDNEVAYIIERLCLNAGDPTTPTQLCVKTPPLGGGDKSGTCQHYPSSCGEDRFFVHYRISTRIRGPKQTLSYVQVMVH
ncbi:MAG: hypothetical protein ABI699_05600 [Caldimonas sp.]